MLYTQVLQADGASYRNLLLHHRLGHTVRSFKENPQHGPALGPLARTEFRENEIEQLLHRVGLPKTSPLSVLAVEILPGPFNIADQRPADAQQQAGPRQEKEDPLQASLGTRRILRTSSLTAVPAIC